MTARRCWFRPLTAACAFGIAAAAQAAADPMRPLVLPAAPQGASAAAPAVLAPARAAVVPLPPLVAIRQDSAGQRQALFGEQWVRPGDRLPGGRQVLAIDERQVQIGGGPDARQDARPQVLSLLPVLQASDAPAPVARPAEPTRPSRRTSSTPP